PPFLSFASSSRCFLYSAGVLPLPSNLYLSVFVTILSVTGPSGFFSSAETVVARANSAAADRMNHFIVAPLAWRGRYRPDDEYGKRDCVKLTRVPRTARS